MECLDTYGCNVFDGLECVRDASLRSGMALGLAYKYEETTTGVTRGKQARAATTTKKITTTTKTTTTTTAKSTTTTTIALITASPTTTSTTTTTITAGYCECANLTYQ
jgi:hypothetical protein